MKSYYELDKKEQKAVKKEYTKTPNGTILYDIYVVMVVVVILLFILTCVSWSLFFVDYAIIPGIIGVVLEIVINSNTRKYYIEKQENHQKKAK